jgi:hypothetical protein
MHVLLRQGCGCRAKDFPPFPTFSVSPMRPFSSMRMMSLDTVLAALSLGRRSGAPFAHLLIHKALTSTPGKCIGIVTSVENGLTLSLGKGIVVLSRERVTEDR